MRLLAEEYLETILDGDAPAAVDLVDRALAGGISPVQIIRDVIVPGQHEVGVGWANGWLNMADEHAATVVSEQALAAVSRSLRSADGGRRVVMACAEGEWHSMPARLAGEQARAAGLQVTMLGGSLPAEHLHAYLLAHRPDALALSVTLTSNLVGASRSIQAAHRAGVPVIVGGAAWGTDDVRARAVGADAWLDDVRELPAVVDCVLARSALAASPPLRSEVLLLAGAPPDLASQALELHLAERREPGSLTAQQAQDRLRDYRKLMKYAAVAVACDDPRVLEETLCWWACSLARQAFDPHWVLAACAHLAVVVNPVAPSAATVLREAGARHAGAPHAASRACGDAMPLGTSLRSAAPLVSQQDPGSQIQIHLAAHR